jgi:predicted lipoprotein with Yx(FWY)xxD motif
MAESVWAHRRATRRLIGSILLLGASFVASVAAVTAAPSNIQLGVGRSATLGTYLIGPTGHTLYTLSSEPKDSVLCIGGCLAAWPPLTSDPGGTVRAPAGVLVRLSPAGVDQTFGTFKRSDNGMTQVSQNGQPLYYFAKDTAAGQTNGEGIAAFGGVWHVAKAILASANPGPPSTSTDADRKSAPSSIPVGLLLLGLTAGVFGVGLIWPLPRVVRRP